MASPDIADGQDTIVVRANQPPMWGDAPVLAEELRIGTLDGPIETSFGRVTHVRPLAGDLLVADAFSTAIRRFGSRGEYLGDVGRSGAGPGEFFEVAGLEPHPEGIAVWDPRNGRISLFREDGEFHRSVAHFTGFFTSDPFAVDTLGNFYTKGMSPDSPRQPGFPVQEVWVKLDPRGELIDSIPIPLSSDKPGLVLYTPLGRLYPFLVRTLSAMSPHGYQVTGSNEEYVLYRPLSDGRTLRIEREHEPVPIHPEERAEWQALIDFSHDARDSDYRVQIPSDTKPALRGLLVDLDGRIWVSRYVTAEYEPEARPPSSGRPTINWWETATWDVIDPRGAFLGTIKTPNGRVLAAKGDRVWVVEVGELDEQYVVQYRIESER